MSDFKSLFETPKKARLTIICLLVALATLGAVIVYIIYSLRSPGPAADPPAGQSESVSAAPAETGPLMGITLSTTLEEAREIALNDAGVAASQAVFSQAEPGAESGVWVYLFKFNTWNAQYEYKVNANTGLIYSKVKESYVTSSPAVTEPPAPSDSAPPEQTEAQPSESVPPAQTAAPRPSNPPQPVQSSQPPAAQLTAEAAKSAALADAGLAASAVTFTKAAPDYENGVLVYEVEFYTSTHEYEYEIDAATGGVYSKSVEAFQTAPTPAPSQSTSMYIGADQAKSIALSHAGLTAAQVHFTRIGMDREDGVMVYEIEFRSGAAEYEYEIDAATGQILDCEVDRD